MQTSLQPTLACIRTLSESQPAHMYQTRRKNLLVHTGLIHMDRFNRSESALFAYVSQNETCLYGLIVEVLKYRQHKAIAGAGRRESSCIFLLFSIKLRLLFSNFVASLCL